MRTRSVARLSVASIAVALVGSLSSVIAQAQDLVLGEETQSVAHRGDKEYHPDNSLAGIESAIAKQADWIEIDLQYNRDGDVFFPSHDNGCSGPGGIALIDTASYEDVVNKCQLPELDDLFDIAHRTGYDSFVYEFKNTPLTASQGGKRLAQEITAQGFQNDSWVSGFSDIALDAVREEQPAINLMRVRTWTGEIPLSRTWIDSTVRRGYGALNINVDALTPEGVDYAHSQGLLVSAWGWPDALEEDNQRAIDLGVDMFMTDRLDHLNMLLSN